MSLDLETVPETAVQGDLLEAAASPLTLSLQDFVSEFGDELPTRSTAPILLSTPGRGGIGN